MAFFLGWISSAVAVSCSFLLSGLSFISVCTWITWIVRCSSVTAFADCARPDWKFSNGCSLYETCTSDTFVSKCSSKTKDAFLASGWTEAESSASDDPSTTWLTLRAFFFGWISSALAVKLSVFKSGLSFIPVCTCRTWTVRCSYVTALADWNKPNWKSSNGASLYETWTLPTEVSMFSSSTRIAFLISGCTFSDSAVSESPSTTWLTLMALFSGWMSSAVAVTLAVLLRALSFIPACTWVTWTVCCSSLTVWADWTGWNRSMANGNSLMSAWTWVTSSVRCTSDTVFADWCCRTKSCRDSSL